jgi:hypothetical protein
MHVSTKLDFKHTFLCSSYMPKDRAAFGIMVRDLRFIPVLSWHKVKLQTVLHWCLVFTNPLNQGCTNSGRKAARVSTFCAVVPDISGLWVWNLLYVISLAPRILKGSLDRNKKSVHFCFKPRYFWCAVSRLFWTLPQHCVLSTLCVIVAG